MNKTIQCGTGNHIFGKAMLTLFAVVIAICACAVSMPAQTQPQKAPPQYVYWSNSNNSHNWPGDDHRYWRY